MRKSEEMEAVAIQFRARIAANRQLTDLLSKNTRDSRVKRIIGLFEEVTPHCKAIPFPATEILKICEQDPVRYRGFHPRLMLLQEELSEAEDFLLELSKRIFLYLEHLKSVGSKLAPGLRQLAESTITELKTVGLELSQAARAALRDTLLKAPGPSLMPYGDDEDTSAKQLKQNRGLREGELPSVGQDYDSRWDPDVKFPGTMFGKFLRFPGPYFAPLQLGRFHEFSLPSAIGDHIDIWQLKYDTLQSNLKKTHRLRIRKPKNCTEDFKTRQKVSHRILSSSCGSLLNFPRTLESLSPSCLVKTTILILSR